MKLGGSAFQRPNSRMSMSLPAPTSGPFAGLSFGNPMSSIGEQTGLTNLGVNAWNGSDVQNGGNQGFDVGPWDPNLPKQLGQPDYKGYAGVGELQPGKLTDQMDLTGYHALKDSVQAGPGNSPWLQMAKKQQAADEANQLNTTAQGAAGQFANQRANMAMRGGLSAGASERMGNAQTDAALLGQQGVRNQGAATRSNLDITGQNMYREDVNNLMGAAGNIANYRTGVEGQNVANDMTGQQSRINNRIADITNENNFGMNIFGQNMAGYGANQTARAIGMGGAGGGGGMNPYINRIWPGMGMLAGK